MSEPGLARVIEGTTELLVPDDFCKKGPGTKRGDLFYNRQMEFGRDISVMFGREMFQEGQKILDGLAATGARGLRLANECGVKADFILNDRNLMAAVLIKENASMNSLEHVAVTSRDLNSLLADEAFDYIDVDPFGTPVGFIDAAVQSCKSRGVIAITATDTAPLYGTYPKTCLRRYGSHSSRSPFAHETGLRILVGYLVREAAKHDRACEPLLCYHADHYFKIYARIVNGANRADAAIRLLGYARYDKESLAREITDSRCGKTDAGPLWTGQLFSKELLRKMSVTGDLGTSSRCEKMLTVWREEATSTPLFYKLDELARRTKHSPPKLVVFIERLEDAGFVASRTHFDPKGFKTDAPIDDLIEIFKR
ncbi:MAG: tRNA (guanine(10)-N(2))-dimethyltransferase [Thermoplasmata archaeon]|nr:tRNA (guanine(10)-N(2))-dimethyltransferase [Thermoplasmata archaeon]